MKITKNDLRTFAFIWALIFFVIGFYPLYKAGFVEILTIHSVANWESLTIRHWSIYTSLVFLIVGLFVPGILSGFYKLWVKFGELIGGVISKIILVILFYGLFTPVALVLKVLGKDLLHKKMHRKSASYWIDRNEQPGSLKNQF